jgi:glycine cleavage system aminomethyltransferase T
VRERVGLFDLTHLGKVEVDGPGALGCSNRS